MASALVRSKIHGAGQVAQEAATFIKIVMFKMGEFNLALHINSVAKVLPQTVVYGSGQNGVGLIHLSDREVTVVDLQRRFFQSSSNLDPAKRGYLMLVQDRQRELYAIPVNQVPTLMDIPLSCVRVLPESYRNADIFGFATHVAVIPATEPPLTIFMLDVDQLLVVRNVEIV
jgi:purine-binding chemotaxis protein CheW